MPDTKPHAPSCDRNSAPILEELQSLLANSKHVLEIASGTGQHAVYFAPRLPHLTWQPTDLPERLDGIGLWVTESMAKNIESPIALALGETEHVFEREYDAVFAANVLHIISKDLVRHSFVLAGNLLKAGGRLIVYGPFNYDGKYTSESNRGFDQWLKDRDPLSGIRDFEWLNELAEKNGFVAQDDIAMPANNRLLVWDKAGTG